MSAIMVTGPCHGKVLEVSDNLQYIKVPFIRDATEGWLYIEYKYLLRQGTTSYYIPVGTKPEEAFAALVDMSGSVKGSGVTERELYELVCDLRKLDQWHSDFYTEVFNRLKKLLS